MVKYIGLAISIFLTLAGLVVGGWGCFLPHWGVALAGFLISGISGYGLAISIKQLQQQDLFDTLEIEEDTKLDSNDVL